MGTRSPAKGPRHPPKTGGKDAKHERTVAPDRSAARAAAPRGRKDEPRGKRPGRPDAPKGRPARHPPKGPRPVERVAAPRTPEPTAPAAPSAKTPQNPPQAERPQPPRPLPSGPRRSGSVALVGRPNVGKSTWLNAALGQPLAAVSHTPQTTRVSLLGVVHHGTAEIALLDTPGLHRPRTELGRAMNEAAREALREADVVVFVAEVPPANVLERTAERASATEPPRVHPGDATLLSALPEGVPAIFVLNKIDLVRNKGLLLPTLQAFEKLWPFAALVPTSALRANGIAVVLDEIAKVLPERAWRYGEDEVTDKPVRFFAAEYVREQILQATKDEVPHATAVAIERFVEPTGNRAVQIDATIHVERQGQKKILVGAGGAMLKRIGTAARLRIEELIGRKVNLKLWVRVTADWRESVRQIEELGYGAASAESQSAFAQEELEEDGLDGTDPDGDEDVEDEQ